MSNYRHGGSHTRLYNIWSSMKSRCMNENDLAYDNYGGRGIRVCDRWTDFSLFREDMGDRPRGMSLDRIDNEQGYSPENCRWASRSTQNRNRRDRRMVTHIGRSMLISDWAKETGLNVSTIWARINKGWDEALAVSTPKLGSRKGLPRDFSFGAQHGVAWSEPMEGAA